MKISDWEKHFEPHILNRGWDYYDDELVEIEHMDERFILASVEGTETYTVEIALDNGHVSEMTCDCPYAADGNNCKHMAAVLFAADDEEWNQKTVTEQIISQGRNDQKSREETCMRLIASLPEEQVRSLLADFAKEHYDIMERILLKEKKAVDLRTKSQWKKDIERITREASDRSGFIDYRHAVDYMVELCSYLRKQIAPLLENRLIMDAFDLVGLVFIEAFSVDLDDDGELNTISAECREYWEELITSPEADQPKMLDWFREQIARFAKDAGEEDLWQVVFDCFTDPGLLPVILDMLDERIRSASKYALPEFIGQRIGLMERMNASETEISVYRMRFWEYPFMRMQELDRLEEEKKWDEALELLCECEKMDAGETYLLDGYSRRRIRILKETGQEQAYRKALREYVFSFPQSDMTYVLELKESVSKEQWQQLLQELFQSEKTRNIRRELQLSEGMLEQMISEIELSHNPYEIKRYEKELRKVYPERVRDILIRQQDEEMKIASTRNGYAKIIQELKHLYGYPDGRKKVKEMVETWKRIFPRRSAMLDELNKAKL